MKVRERQKDQKERIHEFVDLVLRHCPDLEKVTYDTEREGIPHRLFLFGKKAEKKGLFRIVRSQKSSPKAVLSIHRSLKNVDVSFSIANMPQFRSKYISEIEMFKNGQWNKDLVIIVSESAYGECAKKLAKEYEKLSGSDEIEVVLDY